MFASNQNDKAHAKAVSDAIKKALADGTLQARITAILGGSAEKSEKGNLLLRGPGGSRTLKAPEGAEPLEAVPLTPPMKVLTDDLRQ